MLSHTETVRLDFDILLNANRGTWKNLENVAEEFTNEQISVNDVYSRIDFLANRRCIDMRKSKYDSESAYIMVNARVPGDEFGIALLLITLHTDLKKVFAP